MKKDKNTKQPKPRKGRIEHYCRECGELYLERWAYIGSKEPKLIKYYGYCCTKCAKIIDDVAPILQIHSSFKTKLLNKRHFEVFKNPKQRGDKK
jgi:hypothetical protein